jgi:ring-1,2-phenylacetyl-CoA epoxidase subunit PaaA
MVQEALDRWWGPLMQMHGPRTDPAKDRDLYWRIKAKPNGMLRHEFLDRYVPKILELGLTIPDPSLHFNEESGHWEFDEPDWSQLKAVVTGHGPRSAERLTLRRMSYADTEWVRDVVLAHRTAA